MAKIQLIFVCISFAIISNSQDYTMIGDAFDYNNYVEIADALSNIPNNEVTVKAKVNAVCQVKGCWMTLVDDDPGDEIFVKFKDYGFFMPLDLSGESHSRLQS